MTTSDGAPEVWRVECEGGEAREVPVRSRAVLLGTALLERRYQAPRLAGWIHDRRVPDPKIVLGDFNIERKDDLAWQAFTSTGLVVPEKLQTALRSIFDAGGPAAKAK